MTYPNIQGRRHPHSTTTWAHMPRTPEPMWVYAVRLAVLVLVVAIGFGFWGWVLMVALPEAITALADWLAVLAVHPDCPTGAC